MEKIILKNRNIDDDTDQNEKKEIATAYIIQKGIFRIVPLYDYSELSIVDEVLNRKKDIKNLNQFLFQKKGAK